MRHLMAFLVIAGVLAPAMAMADDKNAAQRIANGLRDSGKLSGYSFGVKYDDGTAWLNGQVTDKKQMATAIALTKRQSGVKKVVNNLQIATSQVTPSPVQPASASSPIQAQPNMARMPVQRTAMAGGGPGMPVPSPAMAPVGYGQGATPIPSYVQGAGGAAQAHYDASAELRLA